MSSSNRKAPKFRSLILTHLYALAFAFVFAAYSSLAANLDEITSTNAERSFIGDELLLTFTDTTQVGSFTIPSGWQANARILVVGGGGAGGAALSAQATNYGCGGGGGAGSFICTNNIVLSGASYSVTVGAGGLPQSASSGLSGGTSKITFASKDLLTAAGGGGGGLRSDGLSGGSGGGGSAYNKTTPQNGGSVILGQGQGNVGGDGIINLAGAGGGGAGSKGQDAIAAQIGGNGGDGISCNITGESLFYAGGGGGGAYSGKGSYGGMGGSGVGGRGAYSNEFAVAGTVSRGGGGGGGNNKQPNGAAGGSGIVIVRVTGALEGAPEKPENNQVMQWREDGYTIMRELPFAYTITGEAIGKNIKKYHFSVELKSGFTWSDGTQDKVEIDWEIIKASNYIRNLKIGNWKEGSDPSTPECENGFGAVIYSYAPNIDETPKEDLVYTTVVPAIAGDYFVKAEILESENFEGAVAYAPFKIREAGRSPVGQYGYFAEITNIAYTGSAALTNFPLLVTISDEALNDFYKVVRDDGSDIRFVDADGEYLAHELAEWNYGGVSKFWVKIPELTKETSFFAVWGKVLDSGEAPINDPKVVWSDYAGVWHFDEKNAGDKALDATGKGHDAEPKGSMSRTSTVSAAGVIGTSRTTQLVSSTTKGTQGAYYSVPNYNSEGLKAHFTASGWVKAKSVDSASYPRIFSRKNEYNESGGWDIEVNNGSKTQISVRGSSGTSVQPTIPDMTADWLYLVFEYSNTTCNVYANGILSKSGSIAQATDNSKPLSFGSDSDGSEWNWCGWFDEFRLSAGSKSQEWIRFDYEQVNNSFSVCSFDTYGKSTNVVFENFWKVEPSLSKISWDAGAAPGEFINGEPFKGDAIVKFYDIGNNSYANEMPTAAGVYQIIITVEAKDSYSTLEKIIDFRIADHSPYDTVGDASNQGTSGRILLMNTDYMENKRVTYQRYVDTRTNSVTFWEIEKDNSFIENNYTFNIKSGYNSTLWTQNYGKKLWVLKDCRHGNNFPKDDKDKLLADQNYMPWSSTSRPIDTTNTQSPATRNAVGTLMMRNTTDAVVYSSCFEDGIGTIYFDAVNGGLSANAGEEYRLVVEVATDCATNGVIMLDEAGRPLPPTDENILEPIIEREEVRNEADNSVSYIEKVTGTNYYGLANWKLVWMTPLKRDWVTNETAHAGLDFKKLDTTTNLVLNIECGGTTNNFYRICARVDSYGPARFRIRRVSTSSKHNIDGAFIVLDNIIASPPAMRADMAPFGVFDEAKSGKQVLGQEAAFDVPFPAYNTNIIVRGSAIYTTNLVTEVDLEKFIVAAKLKYRWRYLDQIGETKTIALSPKNGFKANGPLDLPSAVGDVEFSYELSINAPFYDYVDYSGTDLKLGGHYTDEVSSVANGYDAPTDKFDWFVRLREGVSDYEGFNLVVTTDTNEVESTIPMELVGDHLWRGYYQTLSAVSNGVAFKIVGLNPQTPGDTVFRYSAEHYRMVEEYDTLPITSVMESSDENSWGRVPCDATTGYMLFQFDDRSKAITIVHADYQNFNKWNDAVGNKFKGQYTYTNNYATGVSPRAIEMTDNFLNWEETPSASTNWIEHFSSTTDLNYDPYVTFPSTTTPNGWLAGQGMWVYGMMKDKGTGYALQMEGNGRGYVQFVADEKLSPRGLEEIRFKARLGQFIEFDDISYYDAEAKSSMKDYTFVSRAAFDVNNNKDFSGNASISLIAYYRPKVGCYEARWEQVGSKKGNNGITGADSKNQALTIYRWNIDKTSGKYIRTPIYSCTNTVFDYKGTDGITGSYHPFYISVTNRANGTLITAGIKTSQVTENSTVSGEIYSQGDWFTIGVLDTTSNRLTAGTYGLLSANCPAVFTKPAVCDAIQDIPFDINSKTSGNKKTPITFKPTGPLNLCKGTLLSNDYQWAIAYGRVGTFEDSGTWGLKSVVAAQKLELYIGSAGSSTFPSTPYKIYDLTSFGTSDDIVTKIYSTDPASVKFKVGGTVDDVRTDIVIDDIEFRQWAGADWDEDPDNKWYTTLHPENYAYLKNFTFSSAWIFEPRDAYLIDGATGNRYIPTNAAVRLSAKRAPSSDRPPAIRSPLMDREWNADKNRVDGFGSGIGLGMIGYEYTNAQENVILYIQIATNGVSYSDFDNHDGWEPNYWTTIATNDFSKLSADQRRKGGFSYYIGLHGVVGAMRIVMDPKCITNVANQTDENKFGEIDITRVFCRDEPPLDAGCWWGWNIRATEYNATDSWHDNSRAYLPDVTYGLSDGLSMALNNSITAEVEDESDQATYSENMPFVQTPTFAGDIVGEVTFRARKYDQSKSSQPAQITVYGAKSGTDGSEDAWKRIEGGTFIISNTTYTTYSVKTVKDDNYRAFRLCVEGVDGVKRAGDKPIVDGEERDPVRVLIDEVVVSEAIRCRMAFRNVSAFRTTVDRAADLANNNFIEDVTNVKFQPLCHEGWGVQAEIYAAQLGKEINWDRTPQVYLYWHNGTYPWGFENWKADAVAKGNVARLARADGTDKMVYRSSYTDAPDAVIDMSITPGETVQYSLEVVYWQVGDNLNAVTNVLERGDWTRPEWYNPVDYNNDTTFSTNGAYAAYNILDTVAPYWAWINEVNLHGVWDANYNNSDSDYQYVEVAVPIEADITGWSLRFLEIHTDGTVVTNNAAIFGDNELAGKKDRDIGSASNMVFRVIGSPLARDADKLKYADGTLDGVWRFQNPTYIMGASGEISSLDAIGIQLIRSSGVIDHEVTVLGINLDKGDPYWESVYCASNTAYSLNAAFKNSKFFWVGSDDDGGANKSLGVFDSHGEASNFWNNVMVCTPGRVNVGQTINPIHPTPNGESVVVYCNLNSTVGRIRQTVGDKSNTDQSVLLFVLKGNEYGTNITYHVDPWYELGSVTENGKAVNFTQVSDRTYVVNVAKNADKDVNVFATATVRKDLAEKYGLGPDNIYANAVVDWLVKGRTLKGPFNDPSGETIGLADYMVHGTGKILGPLTLTHMYWLDIDPTWPDHTMIFRAGFAIAPYDHVIKDELGNPLMTNKRLGVFMMISNSTDKADYTGPRAWAPYTLRASTPGINSLEHYNSTNYHEKVWDSVSFKVTGILNNGLTDLTLRSENWIPLRWFTFDDNSFDENFISKIEVDDPYSTSSPGYAAGWYDWVKEHGSTPVFFHWDINTVVKPIAITPLKAESFYED